MIRQPLIILIQVNIDNLIKQVVSSKAAAYLALKVGKYPQAKLLEP